MYTQMASRSNLVEMTANPSASSIPDVFRDLISVARSHSGWQASWRIPFPESQSDIADGLCRSLG